MKVIITVAVVLSCMALAQGLLYNIHVRTGNFNGARQGRMFVSLMSGSQKNNISMSASPQVFTPNMFYGSQADSVIPAPSLAKTVQFSWSSPVGKVNMPVVQVTAEPIYIQDPTMRKQLTKNYCYSSAPINTNTIVTMKQC